MLQKIQNRLKMLNESKLQFNMQSPDFWACIAQINELEYLLDWYRRKGNKLNEERFLTKNSKKTPESKLR